MSSFADRLAESVHRVGAPTCVGLDPHLDRLPEPLAGFEGQLDPAERRATAARAAEAFCTGVIEVVAPVAAAVKPQVAFFEALGSSGVAALERVVAAARDAGLVVVLDAKRGDIGSTARAYAAATLDDAGPLAADSVTLSPYLGAESMGPFVERTEAGKGLFVLVRTSNPGSVAWQGGHEDAGIARNIAAWIREQNAGRLGRHGLGPVGAVIGATLPEESITWRRALPHAWLLVPGYGAQGASASDCRALVRHDGLGALIVSARGVLFARSGREGDGWREAVRHRAQAFAADLRSHLPVP